MKTKNNNYIQSIIEQGLSILRTGDVSEAQFQCWLNASQTALILSSKDIVPSVNYRSVILSTMTNNLQPYQKLSMCLRYLISVQNLI